MNVFQSTTEIIETETSKEVKDLLKALTFDLSKFRGKKEQLILYEKLDRNLYETPRYTHTLFDTKRNRMEIERDDFVSNKVKFPKFLPTLRDEQVKAIDSYLLHDDDNILVLPPASGKTILSLCIAGKLGEKTIILVHRSAFFNVWKNDIAKAYGIPASEVGEIRGDKFKIGKQFTLATFQTLHSRNYDIYDEFGLVIGDECLVGSTLIDLADGTKLPIRDIQDGDEVLGGTVSNKFSKIVPKTIKVKVGGKSYEASLRHPMIKVNIVQLNGGMMQRYDLERVMSKDLKLGDLLAIRISRRAAETIFKRKREHVFYRGRQAYVALPVTSVEIQDKPSIVYDFTTTSHTFVANGILSSNCHHVPAETFSSVISKFKAKHMLGVTGTFERTDDLHVLTNLFMGRIAYYNDEADLDHVETANIFRVDTNLHIPLKRGEHMHSMYHKLLSNRERFLQFLDIFEYLHSLGRKQLVFVHSKTYAKLYTAILNHLGYRVMYSMGGNDERNSIAKELMLRGKLDALVATVQYLKEGESINNLDTAHILTPITNRTDWIQSIARTQRKHPDKKKVLVFHYVDNFLPRCMRYFMNCFDWSRKTNSHKYRTVEFDEETLKQYN